MALLKLLHFNLNYEIKAIFFFFSFKHNSLLLILPFDFVRNSKINKSAGNLKYNL